MYFEDAISNLERTSDVLAKACLDDQLKKPQAELLTRISWALYQQATELRLMEHEIIEQNGECYCATGCFRCLGMTMREFF